MKQSKCTLFSLLLLVTLFGCKDAAKEKQTDNTESKKLMKNLEEMAQESNSLNAGNGTYEITALEGWRKYDTMMNGINYTFIKAPLVNGKQASLNVVTEQLPESNIPLDEIIDAGMASLKSAGGKIEKISSKDITISGLPGKKNEYLMEINNHTMRLIGYYVIKDNISYSISAGAGEEEVEKYRLDFEKMANTFTLK
jgi:hypothetical protein